MTLQTSFQIAARLLALTGLLSLLITGDFSPILGAIGVMAVGVSLALALSGRTVTSNRAVWNIANLAVLSFFLVDGFLISRSLLVASSHFVVVLMINKLFNLRTPKDYFQLYLLSLLQLLAAAAYTVDIGFFVVFILFTVAATWAMLLQHLVVEAGSCSAPGSAAAPPAVSRLFFLSTNTVAVSALAATLGLFVMIPRTIGLNIFHQAQSNLVRMSGFSDRVDLGEIGSVKLDFTMGMRVRLSQPMPPIEGLYWRGMVFDYYDGRAWENSFGSGGVLSKEASGVFTLASRWSPARTITQEIIVEPLDTAVVFGAPFAVQVSGRFSGLRRNSMWALSLPEVPATRMEYTVISQLPLLTAEDAATPSFEYPERVRPFLQLPAESERIHELAAEVTRSAVSVLEKIRAIERHLETHYRYTLDVKPASDARPIDDFLFGQKAGFCEHYATAMVLMLRSLGIPSRLVTGFLPGEWNEFGRYYAVRQSNAHAWVEVWFPHSGWFPFDPTPASLEPAVGSFTGWIGRVVDSMKWQWNRYVVYFSFRDQITLAKNVQETAQEVKEWMSGPAMAMWRTLRSVSAAAIRHPEPLAALIVIALVIAYLVRRGIGRGMGLGLTLGENLRLWLRRGPKKSGNAFYFEMLRLLRKRGFEKPATLTPREFLGKISAPQARSPASPDLASLRTIAGELTVFYYRVRFAGIPLSDAEGRRVSDLLHALKSGPVATG